MGDWKTVWITGASTGIGRQLALDLARAGSTVAATARSADKLADLERASPAIRAYPADVADEFAVRAAADRIQTEIGPIDLAILNAAIWEPVGLADFDVSAFDRSMDVNYMGVVRGLAAVLPGMLARGKGHIAIVASVAGYRGLPKAGAYGPTKAALIHLAESLAPEMARHGIRMTVVNPGFVDTPLTAKNDFAMPFMVTAEVASDRILNGLKRRAFEVAFPWQLVTILKIARILPYRLYFWFTRRMARR